MNSSYILISARVFSQMSVDRRDNQAALIILNTRPERHSDGQAETTAKSNTGATFQLYITLTRHGTMSRYKAQNACEILTNAESGSQL